MRIFKEPNMANFICPVCTTAKLEPVILVGIRGTESDGNQEARQVHVDCIELEIVETGDGTQFLLQRLDRWTL